jgi:U6 snRNA-associated Sm-like protein LSm1
VGSRVKKKLEVRITNIWTFRKVAGFPPRWQKAHWGSKKLGSIRYGNDAMGTRRRGVDEFATGNLVLQDTIERFFVKNLYADIERGLFLVRGENVLLLGEIVGGSAKQTTVGYSCHTQDLDKDDYVPPPYEAAPVEKVFAMKKEEDKENKKINNSRQKKLAQLGFEGEHAGEVIF